MKITGMYFYCVFRLTPAHDIYFSKTFCGSMADAAVSGAGIIDDRQVCGVVVDSVPFVYRCIVLSVMKFSPQRRHLITQ